MTLVNVDLQMLFFSDRPQDIAGFLSFGELVKLVGASINVPAGMIVETELAGPLDLPL